MQHATSSEHPALSEALRKRTRDLHRHAETSGIVARILSGSASRSAYGALLRNLHPVYHCLEATACARPGGMLALLVPPALFRAQAIEADLNGMLGSGWRAAALLPSAQRYAERVARCARDDEHLLLAHAYVRYLGDLSGGQIMRELLADLMALDEASLSFYRFPQVSDVAVQRRAFREALDGMPLTPVQRSAVIEEAALAFEHNIDLSNAILADSL